MDSGDEEEWSKPLEEITDDGNRHVDQQKTGEHPRVILHIDIDCFYAQVEMIRNPELRNKPLGIQQKYIIVTCNYVARERGLTKLMSVKDAREKCPDLVMVNGEDLTNYRNMSYRISNYLQQYSSLVERLGFDENFLDITELVNDRMNNASVPSPTEVRGHVYTEDSYRNGSCSCDCHARLVVGSHIAAEIRAGLFKELGVTCCGGIAHNKLLSKLVAGTHKPNQQTTLFVDDVNILMSRLSSVRGIPGIGHTTARRLKDMEVITVTDLQNTELSVLVEEFGKLPAVTMKRLCVGIDDSPVIPFGLPQTLSDEDSFKKCSDVKDAKAKIKQLISSLLHRLLEDGRRPQTLRLSVRRMLETNRYNNRESRQCNIPSTVFNKFSSDNHAHTVGQLELLAFSLFTKMVDTHSPFHLTLINVAFAKLEQKSSNDIATFFSPKKASQTPSGKALDKLDGAGPSNMEEDKKYLNSKTNEPPETKVNLDSVTRELGKSENVKSPSSNHGNSTSEIQKWFVKQMGNIDKANIGQVQHSEKELTLKDKKNLNEFERRKSSKRLSSEVGDLLSPESLTKRAKMESADVIELLPADLDVNVFLELPADIQKDILANTSSHTSYDSLTKPSMKTDINNKTSSKGSTTVPKSTTRSTFSASACTSMNVHNIITDENNKLGETDSCENTKVTDTSSNSDTLPSVSSNMPRDKLDTEKLEATTSEAFTIPADIDPGVFESLPQEIRQELIQQWKNEKQSSGNDLNVGNTNKQNTLYFKSPKPSTSRNITNYFPKRS